MKMLEAMASRRSVRRYGGESVAPGALEEVRRAGVEAAPLGGGRMEFLAREGKEVEEGILGLAGDYARVLRAPHYIVLAAEPAEHYLLDCGFRFEQLVLRATQLGLGTCWVGGFLHEERLRRILRLRDPWRIVVLTPLGHPSSRTGDRLVDGAMKIAVGASRRKPPGETFFWGEWGRPLPGTGQGGGSLALLLEAVRRAPSWANRQPWRLVVRPREVFLYKAGQQVKAGKDYHLVDCGIAMCHLHLAARDLGLGGRWIVGGGVFPASPPGHEPVGRYILERAIVPP